MIFVLRLLGYRRLWRVFKRVLMLVPALLTTALRLGVSAVAIALLVKGRPGIQKLIVDQQRSASSVAPVGSYGLDETAPRR